MIRVLVVDDDPEISALLHLGLADDDIAVVGCRPNIPSAVTLAAMSQPDVILLDYNLPEIDGLHGLPLLKEACPKALICFFSGVTPAGVVPHPWILKTGDIVELRENIKECWSSFEKTLQEL